MSSTVDTVVAGWDTGHIEDRRVSLLDDVATAAARVRAAEEELRQARAALHAAMRKAHVEGIPAAAVARSAGLSRERARQILIQS